MAVTETTIITAIGQTFATIDDAVDAFLAANPSAELDAAIAFSNDAVTSGDMIQTTALNADNAGFTFNRTWTDSKWTEGASMNYPSTIEGWRVDSTNDA